MNKMRHEADKSHFYDASHFMINKNAHLNINTLDYDFIKNNKIN